MGRRSRWTWRTLALIGAVVMAGLGLLATGLASSHGAPPVAEVSTPSSCADSSQSLYGFGSSGRVISQTQVPVCVTGQVTVSFAGDPATGCAARGLCGYQGTESWRPQGPGDLGLLTFVQNGRRSIAPTLVIGAFGTPVVSSVTLSGPPGHAAAAGDCHDRARAPGAFLDLAVHAGRTEIGLGEPQEGVFGTRCAGPLSVDVAAALPRRSVTLAQLRHGHLHIDLSSSHPFAAGGFSGTVVSTVQLALGAARTQPEHVTSPPGSQPTRLETVRYAVSASGRGAVAAVSTAGTACGGLDACGLAGTISLAPRFGASAGAFLTASSVKERSVRDLLTALGVDTGGDTSGITVNGAGDASGGTVTAKLRQAGATCTDRVELDQTGVLLRVRAGRLVISVDPETTQAVDPLRTRCPGPALAGHTFSSASLPATILRQARFTVQLQRLPRRPLPAGGAPHPRPHVPA